MKVQAGVTIPVQQKLIEQPNNAPPGEAALAQRLLRALVAKTSLEILFLCGLATYAAFGNFHPLLRGAIDVAERRQVAGWAHDPLAPNEALEVQLFVDDRFVTAQRATQPRADLVAAGAAPVAERGFRFELAGYVWPVGEHAVQVYAVRAAAGSYKTLLPLAKNPLKIVVPPVNAQ